MEKVGRSVFKGNTIADNLLILSCEEDYASCVPFLEKGQKLFHSALKTCYLLKIKYTMFCTCRGNGVQFRTVAEWHRYSEAGVSEVIFCSIARITNEFEEYKLLLYTDLVP